MPGVFLSFPNYQDDLVGCTLVEQPPREKHPSWPEPAENATGSDKFLHFLGGLFGLVVLLMFLI